MRNILEHLPYSQLVASVLRGKVRLLLDKVPLECRTTPMLLGRILLSFTVSRESSSTKILICGKELEEQEDVEIEKGL